MGAWQQIPERFTPQNVRSTSRGELIGRIGLPALEPLRNERATEPVDVIAHPAFEPTKRQSNRVPTDRCPTRGTPPVADSHLATTRRPYRPRIVNRPGRSGGSFDRRRAGLSLPTSERRLSPPSPRECIKAPFDPFG